MYRIIELERGLKRLGGRELLGGAPTMSSPLIVAVPKKQPLSHGTAARGKLDSVANVTECASHALAASLHARWASAPSGAANGVEPALNAPCPRARRFSIPELKIGTYDKLVQLSDDIEKVASTVESTTARLHKQLLDSRCVACALLGRLEGLGAGAARLGRLAEWLCGLVRQGEDGPGCGRAGLRPGRAGEPAARGLCAQLRMGGRQVPNPDPPPRHGGRNHDGAPPRHAPGAAVVAGGRAREGGRRHGASAAALCCSVHPTSAADSAPPLRRKCRSTRTH